MIVVMTSARYAERGTVRAWFLAIVHHRAIDHVRRRAYREERQQALDAVADPPDSADTWEQARRSVEGFSSARAFCLTNSPPNTSR